MQRTQDGATQRILQSLESAGAVAMTDSEELQARLARLRRLGPQFAGVALSEHVGAAL
jgi:hypothetical protein